MWFVLYILVISAAGASAFYLYEKHDSDQLPSGYISLELGKTEYQLGETIEFDVINHFPVNIHVANQCPSEPLHVYRWENDEWVQIHDTAEREDSECYTEPRTIVIPADGSRGYDFDDWPNLFSEPGVYRIAMTIDHYGDVPFKDFKILEPAKTVEATQNTQTQELISISPILEYSDDEVEYDYEDEEDEE